MQAHSSTCATTCAASGSPTKSRRTSLPSCAPLGRHPDVQLGASPRATVALYRAAQAAALLDGRAFVLPDDVKAVAVAVLAHRLILDFDRGLRGASPDGVMAEILGSVGVPPVTDPAAGS